MFFTSGLKASLVNIPLRHDPRDGVRGVLKFCNQVEIMTDRGQKSVVTYEFKVSEFSYEVKYDLQGRHGLVGHRKIQRTLRTCM